MESHKALKESAWGPSKVGGPGKDPWLHKAKDDTGFQIQKWLLVVDLHHLSENST